MSISKAKQQAVNRYVKRKYDRFNLIMEKGKKEIIKNYAEKNGLSVNSYINLSIDRQIELENQLQNENEE